MHFNNVRMVNRLKKFELIVSHLGDLMLWASNDLDSIRLFVIFGIE